MLLGALGLGLTLEAVNAPTGCYKSKVARHGITPCGRLEQRVKIYYAQDLLYGADSLELFVGSPKSLNRGIWNL